MLKHIGFLVGVRGFEPPASWSRTKHSTKLSHTPVSQKKYLFLLTFVLYTISAGLSTTFRENFIRKNRRLYMGRRFSI